MGHGVKELMYLDAWGEFSFHFLQNYTVKIFENDYIIITIITVIVMVTVNRNQLIKQANL